MNLNPAHIHLLVNHIPVFGTIFAALLMAWGLARKSEEVVRVGLIAAVIVAILTWGVNLTGDPAIHFIRGIPGVERARVHEHEQAGDWATWGASLAGIVSLITLVLMMRRRRVAAGLTVVSMLLSALAFVIAARAATLGGEIRHPEIRAGFVPPAAPPPSPGAPGGDGDEKD
jgi:hypothetical protein